MDSARAQALGSSLRQRLDTQPEPGRTRWVGDQLENYLERWLAFRALSAASVPPVDDDLFKMIEIGAEVMTDELRRAKVSPELAAHWERFLDLLAQAREHCDEGLVGQLRSKLVQVRSSS